MCKCLVIVQGYPDTEGNKALMFVHVRNKYYMEHGIDVTVLCFSARKDYCIDGIKVLSDEKKIDIEAFDCVVCHAPNVRNHWRFLRTRMNRARNVLFFFHGHEIVKINDVYPEEYRFKYSFLKKKARGLYDIIKLRVWRSFFKKNIDKSTFIFVSRSLYADFLKYVKLSRKLINDKVYIINNSVGQIFEQSTYDDSIEKIYDFITIRSNMDSSVYCMDLIRDLAIKYPRLRFLVIGQGRFFEYMGKPDNIELVNKVVNHQKMLTYIDQAKMALMPTRRDSQGVMSCELLTYGIPLITSDISVCREMFEDKENALLVDFKTIDLNNVLESRKTTAEKPRQFYADSTISQETELINLHL